MITNTTAAAPAKMQQASQALDDREFIEAALTCGMCRERHGGWCIDETWPSGPALCPLAGLAPTTHRTREG